MEVWLEEISGFSGNSSGSCGRSSSVIFFWIIDNLDRRGDKSLGS